MIGMISGFPSMPMPSDRNRNNGAKIWLVPSSDIDCTAVNKTIIDSPNYAMYMFSGEKEFLNYDYLGD